MVKKSEKSEDALKGVVEIAKYLNRSIRTVMYFKQRYEDFPMQKIDGSVWESSKKKLEQWRDEHLTNGLD